jgi:hypothetical protein
VKQGTSTLVGVVSWAQGCARLNKYSVGARVSKFVSWINTTIEQASEIAFVDLTGPTLRERNATVSTNGGQYWPQAGGWRFLGPGQSVTVNFTEARANQAMQLVLLHCTSAIWPKSGYSPVTISLNGTVIASNFDVGRHHDGTRDYAWDSLPVPASAVRQGANVLTIVTQPGMISHYWLRSVRLASR